MRFLRNVLGPSLLFALSLCAFACSSSVAGEQEDEDTSDELVAEPTSSPIPVGFYDKVGGEGTIALGSREGALRMTLDNPPCTFGARAIEGKVVADALGTCAGTLVLSPSQSGFDVAGTVTRTDAQTARATLSGKFARRPRNALVGKYLPALSKGSVATVSASDDDVIAIQLAWESQSVNVVARRGGGALNDGTDARYRTSIGDCRVDFLPSKGATMQLAMVPLGCSDPRLQSVELYKQTK